MRDTDADWERIAASDPYFGVLTADKFRNKHIDADALREFFETGENDLDFALRYFPQINRRDALDFGCGVGRLSLALSSKFESVTGIDASESMLAEARKNAGLRHAANVEFMKSTPPGQSFDFVLSYIVFQHIPPKRGITLLRGLSEAVRSGGAIAIQLTLYREGPLSSRAAHDYGFVSYDGERVISRSEAVNIPGEMMMYDYDATDILAHLFQSGFHDLRLVKTDHGGHVGTWFFGVKATQNT
jgi:SAM-dependent methyltransferase